MEMGFKKKIFKYSHTRLILNLNKMLQKGFVQVKYGIYIF